MRNLNEQLQGAYDLILTHVPVYHRKRNRIIRVGEVDLLAKRGELYDLYEVKCSYRAAKARMQLRKLRKRLQSKYNIARTYFYCGSNASLVGV